MRRIFMAAAGAALFLAPTWAVAQSDRAAPSATGMKGSPNAAGYGTDTGMANGGTVVGGAGSSADKEPTAQGMKGSPNADGYKK